MSLAKGQENVAVSNFLDLGASAQQFQVLEYIADAGAQLVSVDESHKVDVFRLARIGNGQEIAPLITPNASQ